MSWLVVLRAAARADGVRECGPKVVPLGGAALCRGRDCVHASMAWAGPPYASSPRNLVAQRGRGTLLRLPQRPEPGGFLGRAGRAAIQAYGGGRDVSRAPASDGGVFLGKGSISSRDRQPGR